MLRERWFASCIQVPLNDQVMERDGHFSVSSLSYRFMLGDSVRWLADASRSPFSLHSTPNL